MKMMTAALAALLLLACPAVADDSLAGRWVHRSDFLAGWIVLLPDGRYWSVLTVPGVEQAPEAGTYETDGSHLTIRSGGNEVTYDLEVEGDRMTLSGGNLAQPLLYEREPGSADRVVEEARQADATKAREDDDWRARFPLARLEKPYSIPAVGEVGGDEGWQRIFEGATVFEGPQTYVSFTTTEYMYRPGQGPAGRYKGDSKWYFQSNGRVFLTSTRYVGSVTPPDVEQPFWGLYYIENKSTLAYWGRYRIAADDTFYVELDDGSTLDATFLDGRRNLWWEKGGDRCGNVTWEQWALDRQMEKNR
ncbi:MAG: hypothetical protein HY720_23315 [Planctomycetes bacterium]|nr:hypothetical protein [Planctomycetota bacterium]